MAFFYNGIFFTMAFFYNGVFDNGVFDNGVFYDDVFYDGIFFINGVFLRWRFFYQWRFFTMAFSEYNPACVGFNAKVCHHFVGFQGGCNCILFMAYVTFMHVFTSVGCTMPKQLEQ